MDDRNSREQRPLLIAEFNLRGKNQKFEMTNISLSLLRDLLPGLLTLLPREDEAYGGSPRDEEEGGTREASGSSRISDTLRRAFRSYPRSRAEGKRTSARITRPRFLRNLREISRPRFLCPPKTNVSYLEEEEEEGVGRVSCDRGKQLFDSWLEHLSREIYVVRGQRSLMVIN